MSDSPIFWIVIAVVAYSLLSGDGNKVGETPTDSQLDAVTEQATDEMGDYSPGIQQTVGGKQYNTYAGSYDCTVDCSGHDAGYQWAQENGAADASDCNGNSNSFNEGCEAFVNDVQERERELLENPEELETYEE